MFTDRTIPFYFIVNTCFDHTKSTECRINMVVSSKSVNSDRANCILCLFLKKMHFLQYENKQVLPD